MANKPDDPQRPHPDESNPASAKGQPPSDSAIDLGMPGEDDLSGISVIEWAKLVENPAGDSKPGLGQAPVKAREEDIAEILAEVDAALPEPAKPTTGSDSSIDLSDSVMPVAADVMRSAGIDDDSAIDLLEPARVVEKPAPMVTDDDSAIELGDAALIGGSSVVNDALPIDLGPEAVKVPEKRPGEGSGSNSEIDLGDPMATPAVRKPDSDVNFLADDILLDPASGTSSSGGSSRDLVAETLESGVDLMGGKKSKLPASTDDSIEDDFLTKDENDQESSSVDLGSMNSVPVFDVPDDIPAKSTKRTVKPSANISPSSSEIDLDMGEEPAAKQDTGSVSEVDLDVDSAPDIELLAMKGAKKPKSSGSTVLVPASDEPAAKPARRNKAATAVGGLACGLAGAVLALGGAWASGFMSSGSGSAAPKQGFSSPIGPAPGAGAPVASAPVVAAEATMDRIRTGDFDKVTDADLEKIDSAKADQLVARAQFHWLKYQLIERGKNPRAVLKPDAEPIKTAFADLEKAISLNDAEASANALFLRAEIHEMTGNAAAARAEYQAGATKFAADPTQKLRFETALQLLDLESSTKVGQLSPALPPRLAALLLVTLQQPPGEGAPQLPPEAGFSFWQAVKQAKAGNYAEALKLLDDSRSRHDQRRYLLPKKQQNPLSDPRERIFLHSCDELKNYWSLLAKLSNPNYLAADSKSRVAQVEALLTKAGETAAAATLKNLAAKLAKDAKVATADDLVKAVEAERNAKDSLLKSRDSTIGEQRKEIANLGDKAKEASIRLAKTLERLTTTEASLKQSQAANDAAVATLKEVAAVVSSDFTDVKTSKDALLREIRSTVKVAKTADSKGTILKLERELAEDRARLAERWAPTELMAVWMPLLDRERGRKDLAARAAKDAQRVLADASAKPETKGQALLVQGLALRNEEKFREAVPVLTKAQVALQGSAGDAVARCEAALKEASDPVATIAARANSLDAEGKRTEAMDVIERGLKGIANGKGTLLVQRCKIAFEAARSKGPLAAADPLVTAARDDAAAAAKEGLAEGQYCLGRIDEELGRLGDAEKNYRAALKGHGKLDADGSRYRVALARVLMRQRSETAPRTGRGPVHMGPVGLLLALTIQGVPAGATSGEAESLADEVLALGDKAPFGARAQALAIKGLHTQAVKTYVTGLRDANKLAPEYANTLLDLYNAQPGMRRVESMTRADPVKAEQCYSSGLNAFFARNYPNAEKDMLAAVENDSSDARYYYFLGLARLAQGKREAYEDFDQGKRLEEMDRPDRAAVASALERVQGRLRKVLNDVREAPVIEKAK